MVTCKCGADMIPAVLAAWPGGRGFVCPGCHAIIVATVDKPKLVDEWNALAQPHVKAALEIQNAERWPYAN